MLYGPSVPSQGVTVTVPEEHGAELEADQYYFAPPCQMGRARAFLLITAHVQSDASNTGATLDNRVLRYAGFSTRHVLLHGDEAVGCDRNRVDAAINEELRKIGTIARSLPA
jgi:hypothetical protein